MCYLEYPSKFQHFHPILLRIPLAVWGFDIKMEPNKHVKHDNFVCEGHTMVREANESKLELLT